MPTSGQVFTSASPTDATSVSGSTASPMDATSVSGSTAKEKTNKKDKVIKNKETKHENIAKEKEATKYELEEDGDGFANDDI